MALLSVPALLYISITNVHAAVSQCWLCLAAGKSQAVAQAVAQALTSGDNSTAKAMVGAWFFL
jgi:hypothetical protein